MKRYSYLIESKEDYMTVSHPIAIEPKTKTIAKNITIYISPEIYAKNIYFMKSLVEVNEVIVTSTMLQNFRNQLSDQSYTDSKIHGFRGSSFKKMVISKDDFVLPDFKIDINLKDRKYSSQTLRDLFEHSYSLLNTDTKVKTLAPSNIESALMGKLEYIKNLSKSINLKSLTHTYENFFLYDLENIIKPTFVTELGKNFSIYGLISFSGKTKENNKLDLIRPSDSLNFQLLADTYKNSLTFELGKVHEKNSYNVVGDKVFNIRILRSEKNKTLGRKRFMGAEIVDKMQILGVQDKDKNFLNPIVVSISSDDLIRQLTKYKKYKYRFVLESLVFSSNFENNIDVIFVSSEG